MQQNRRSTAVWEFDGNAAIKRKETTLVLHRGTPRAQERPMDKTQVEHATFGQKVFAAVVAAALIAVLALCLAAAQAASARDFEALVQETPAICISAQPGDTLWSIASKHQLKERSVQETVTWIKSRNNLDSSYIEAGQLLHVPNI